MTDAWAATAEFPFGALRPEGPPAGKSLIVRHPDGTVQKVLTVRELVEAGLLDSVPAGQAIPSRRVPPQVRISVAAWAPDRLWLQLIRLDNLENPPPYYLVRRIFYEVQDPNGDGDWSDRTVVPLALPSFVAEQRRSDCCSFMQLIAEPSVGGEDRPDSLLLTVNTDGEQRIYRVSDLNGDGDVMDFGEFELLFSGRERAPDAVVPRVVIQDGEVVLRELVVSGLTTHTRVSRLSETGKVIDIARAFSSISEVLADSKGNIYVWAFPPDGSSARVLYKLEPVLAK